MPLKRVDLGRLVAGPSAIAYPLHIWRLFEGGCRMSEIRQSVAKPTSAHPRRTRMFRCAKVAWILRRALSSTKRLAAGAQFAGIVSECASTTDRLASVNIGTVPELRREA